MAKSSTRETVKAKWLSPSVLRGKCFHTPIGNWFPKKEFPPLVLFDTRENFFCIWKVIPDHDGVPIKLPGRFVSDFDRDLSALKMAYLHLSMTLQLYSSILPPGYSRIAIFYTPSARRPKLPEDEAWEIWHDKYPHKQPFVERLCIETEDSKKICWNVSPNGTSVDFLSLTPSLGFLEHLRVGVQAYNTWLARTSHNHHVVIIPAYFEFGFFTLEHHLAMRNIPVFEY